MELVAVSVTQVEEAPEVAAAATTTPAVNMTGVTAPGQESLAPGLGATPPESLAEEQPPC